MKTGNGGASDEGQSRRPSPSGAALPRRKKRHPAKRARSATLAASLAAAGSLTGWFAASGPADSPGGQVLGADYGGASAAASRANPAGDSSMSAEAGTYNGDPYSTTQAQAAANLSAGPAITSSHAS